MLTWLASKAELLETRPERWQVFLTSHFAVNLTKWLRRNIIVPDNVLGFDNFGNIDF